MKILVSDIYFCAEKFILMLLLRKFARIVALCICNRITATIAKVKTNRIGTAFKNEIQFN